MVPSGPPAGAGGAQQPSPSLLRSNSSLLGGGAAGQPFASLVSPRSQFGSNAMLGNISNISALLNNSFGNGGTGMPAPPQRGAEQDPLAFASPSGAAQPQHYQTPSGSQFGSDLPHPMQLHAVQNFSQQQHFLQHNSQQQQQLRGGGGAGPMKMDQQIVPGEQNGPSAQQLQSLRGGMGHAKMELQQLQQMRGFAGAKMESHNSEQSMFMQRQQQQQQMMQLSRQNSQEAATQQLNMLQQQQRVMQIHQQQQQQRHQMLNSSPQRRAQLQHQQQQQQLQQNSLSARPEVKPSIYEPGTCARRLTYYMHHQQRRPQDNNIEFWKKFIAEYFAPNAKKRWCVSLYGNGRQTTGVSQQDIWHCEICNRKPGRGFETTVEVLPRLCQIKYASGTLEELLYVDMPHEYHNSSGQIVLDYAKAVQESVFEQLRVVRDGQLRIVFNQDLKISSWEFCARHHEELIPRRLLIPQVTQLGVVVQKYQATAQDVSSSLSPQDLQNTCNSFVTTARQLAKALEVPLVNDLGYTKRYVRCLQISEVVNSLKDLIDYSSQTGSGPIDSLINFPQRTTASSVIGPQHSQQHEGQQSVAQNANTNDHNSVHALMQISATNTGVGSMNNPLNSVLTTTSTTTSVGLHQKAPMVASSANSLYGGGNTAHVASTNPSNSIALAHPNPSSPFTSPTISASNIPTSNSHSTGHLNYTKPPANMPAMQQAATPSQEIEGNDSQSSVQQIIQDVMMCTQLNGSGSLGSEMEGIDGVTPVLSGSSSLVGNGMLTNSTNLGISGMGFGSMGTLGQSAMVNGIRGAMPNNAMAGNGRVGKNSIYQDHAAMSRQHDMGNRLLGKLGAVNNFNNLQFDWKSSP